LTYLDKPKRIKKIMLETKKEHDSLKRFESKY